MPKMIRKRQDIVERLKARLAKMKDAPPQASAFLKKEYGIANFIKKALSIIATIGVVAFAAVGVAALLLAVVGPFFATPLLLITGISLAAITPYLLPVIALVALAVAGLVMAYLFAKIVTDVINAIRMQKIQGYTGKQVGVIKSTLLKTVLMIGLNIGACLLIATAGVFMFAGVFSLMVPGALTAIVFTIIVPIIGFFGATAALAGLTGALATVAAFAPWLLILIGAVVASAAIILFAVAAFAIDSSAKQEQHSDRAVAESNVKFRNDLQVLIGKYTNAPALKEEYKDNYGKKIDDAIEIRLEDREKFGGKAPSKVEIAEDEIERSQRQDEGDQQQRHDNN